VEVKKNEQIIMEAAWPLPYYWAWLLGLLISVSRRPCGEIAKLQDAWEWFWNSIFRRPGCVKSGRIFYSPPGVGVRATLGMMKSF
jgi:hypothetical protein